LFINSVGTDLGKYQEHVYSEKARADRQSDTSVGQNQPALRNSTKKYCKQ